MTSSTIMRTGLKYSLLLLLGCVVTVLYRLQPSAGPSVAADANHPAERATRESPSLPAATPYRSPTAANIPALAIDASQSADLDSATITAQALGEDATARTAAIAALAAAPTSQAVPVLSLVLNGGQSADRQHALEVLRKLFASRGDRNGAIRDALRTAVYHVADEEFVATVQSALDAIEAEISSPGPAKETA